MLQTPPQLEFSLSSLSERDIDINITSAAAGCPTAGYMYIQSTQSSISMGSWTTLEGYGKGRYLDDGCVRSFSCSPAASPFSRIIQPHISLATGYDNVCIICAVLVLTQSDFITLFLVLWAPPFVFSRFGDVMRWGGSRVGKGREKFKFRR